VIERYSMVFKNLKGYPTKVKSSYKYKIDWDGKSLSKLQRRAKILLYEYWHSDFVYEELPVAGTRMSLDFYNASQKIAIEVDGNQHYSFSKFFHSNNKSKFIDQLRRDDDKERFCELNEITLHRVREDLDLQEQIESLDL
jgi:uncharacterized C2H2 Zn-finger protein